MPTTLTPEDLARITERTGQVARLLAKHKEVEGHLTLLAAQTGPSIQVTVQATGAHFQMRLPIAALVAQHETDLAQISARLLDASGVPLNWQAPEPAAVPAHEPPPVVPAAPLSPTTTESNTHV